MKQSMHISSLNKNDYVLVVDKPCQDFSGESRDLQKEISQERLQAVAELTGGMTHHFNNILQSIISSAELVRLHTSSPALVEKDLTRIIQQSREAADLIQQLLDFSRQSIDEKQPVDLVALVKKLIEALKSTLPQNIDPKLTVAPRHKGYILRGDPGQLQQALTNLACNAQEAMPMGGNLQFRLSTLKRELNEWPLSSRTSSDECIVLSVSDTGVGISPEIHPYIFEPFFTTKDVGQGTGLGLAQVYGIVKQHQGEIKVTTRVGEGTTFTLYLPTLSGNSK